MRTDWNRRSLIKAGFGAAGAAAVGLEPELLFGAEKTGTGQHAYPASPYYKSIGFLKRLPKMTHEEFVKHWVDVHAPIFKAMPGLVKYRLNIIDPVRSRNAPYDGAAEVWFENEQAFRGETGLGSEIWKKSRADGKLLIQPGETLGLATTEYVIMEPPVGPKRPKVKRLGAIQRTAGVSYAEFVHEWVDVHAADYLKTTPGIRGYTINVVHESEKTPWGGYASLWWDDQASYDEGERANAASLKATQAQRSNSGQNAAGNSGFMSAICTDIVIL